MAIFLDRIDAAPLEDDDFSFSINSWFANTVDTINEDIEVLESNLNGMNEGVIVGSFTQAEILSMAPTATDGTIYACPAHSPPCLVVVFGGTPYQISTTAFP